MYLTASRATSCFCSSWVMMPLLLSHRRQVGAHAFEDFCREAHRLGERGMWMDRLADVDCVGAHLDRERDLADEIACARADDTAADDAVRVGVEEKLGEAFVAAVGDGAARRDPGKLRLLYLRALRLGLVFGQSDPRHL